MNEFSIVTFNGSWSSNGCVRVKSWGDTPWRGVGSERDLWRWTCKVNSNFFSFKTIISIFFIGFFFNTQGATALLVQGVSLVLACLVQLVVSNVVKWDRPAEKTTVNVLGQAQVQGGPKIPTLVFQASLEFRFRLNWNINFDISGQPWPEMVGVKVVGGVAGGLVHLVPGSAKCKRCNLPDANTNIVGFVSLTGHDRVI